ncbi:terpene synthase family protein [Streptomyces sp. NPDC006645]|uniref:terpene synthase family protein n=1 Tax=unclassified Streptomyces TaxID=2593676 RepID=UPI0033BBCEB6
MNDGPVHDSPVNEGPVNDGSVNDGPVHDAIRTHPRALPMPDLRDSFPGPFPASAHADDIERHATQWLRTFPLIVSERALGALTRITGQGVARTFPTAGRDELFLCADLFLWLTAFDDAYGEAAGAADPARLVRTTSEFVHLLAGHHEPPGGPSVFGAALRDLLDRYGERATPAQYARLTAHLRDNLFGILWEAHHLHRADRVTLPDYRAMRPHTVFVRTVIATAEVMAGYELPEPDRSSEPVRELETAVADLAGWINDLASYAKESAHDGPATLSLPALLMRQHECDLEEAFRRASRMCEERAAVAAARIAELTAREGPSADHARALGSVAASYVWHIDDSRYQS